MDYKKFEESIIEIIKKNVDNNAKISLHTVCKNNGIKLTGLVILNEDESVSPTIYLEPFYEMACKGEDLKEIADEILHLCNEQKGQFNFDVENFQDINSTKKKILYKLINYDKNEDLLRLIPHRKWMDLAIVYYVLVSCNELGSGTILIKNEHLKYWNVSEADLFEYASENTPVVLKKEFKSMAEIIKDFIDDRIIANTGDKALNEDVYAAKTVKSLDDSTPIKMYVMGNRMKLNGACVVLYEDTLSEFAKYVDNDFYILPSSIHEVILVPADEAVDEKALLSLVREVNENNVIEEEWLSDNIYKYLREEALIAMIS